jgi:fatty acid desaturase
MLGVILLLGLADAWAWIGWIQGSWLACLLLPFIHWVFVVNVAHDAAHFAFSNSVWVNEIAALVSSPLYFNTAFWYLQHNISHHTHTNEVGLDIDLYHGAPWTRFHPLDRWTGVHRIQIATVAGMDFLWATFAETYLYPTFMLMRNSTSKRFFGDYEKVLLYNTRGLVIQLILGGAVVLWPLLAFSLLKAVLFILYPHFAAGIIFMTITQISHIQEATQRTVTDGGSDSSSSRSRSSRSSRSGSSRSGSSRSSRSGSSRSRGSQSPRNYHRFFDSHSIDYIARLDSNLR